MGEQRKLWAALVIRERQATSPDRGPISPAVDAELVSAVSAVLDDYSPLAIEDLTIQPLPAGDLWDPTMHPPLEPPDGPLQWRVFFGAEADRNRAADALQGAFDRLEVFAEEVSDEDWAARSQRELSAISAGPFVVAPPWDKPASPAGSTLVVIEPSRGFGTGHHASTRLCLRALGETAVPGARVLDIGTGSGVLALAASLRGARSVTAIDVDPDAIDAARQSAALNPHAVNIEWLVGDFRDRGLRGLHGSWDLVLANLTGAMLKAAAERLRELSAGGLLIASGFDEHERRSVEDALHLAPRAAYSEDGWIGLTLSPQAVADSSPAAGSSLR